MPVNRSKISESESKNITENAVRNFAKNFCLNDWDIACNYPFILAYFRPFLKLFNPRREVGLRVVF